MTAILLALAVMFAQSPAERKMRVDAMILEGSSTRTIEKGDQSNVDDAKQVLVRTEAEWTRLWNQHAPDHPRPRVDFSKEMVVAVFMGSRPNAGFSTTITSAMTANGALVVRYKETMPGPGTVSAQVLTFPYHIVAIAKADVKDLKFQKDAK
jgi:protease stability complex PrcB-like protein